MRKYEADERGRQIVLRLGAIHNVDLESIAFAITNPRTNKPITVKILTKHYSRELKLAKVEMQKLVMDSFVEQLKAGNAQALKIGLASYCGLKDNGAQITVQTNTQNNNIAWTIRGVESPNIHEPVPGSDDIDLIPNAPEPMRQLPRFDPVPMEPPQPIAGQEQPYRTELDLPGATALLKRGWK